MYPDNEISELSKEDILNLLSKVAPGSISDFKDCNLEVMQRKLKLFQRNRALWVWSDHSVLQGYGLVLIVVGIVYDPLVFYTDSELAESHKTKMNVQELVEQGEIYIMTHCSSSSADQAGLTPERVACLDTLSDPITTESGIKIYDTVRFFKGDKQSAWFEAGIQRGGHYCCIACDCHTSNSFTNFTKAHHSKLRGFTNIQERATIGVFGKIPNRVNFFESLNAEELKREQKGEPLFEKFLCQA